MTDADTLLFKDEDEPKSQRADRPTWDILIVDDDPDVHTATEFALKGMEILDRPLRLLHAYSGNEGFSQLRTQHSIAVVLLDVVMETEQAGLQLVNRLRHELNNPLTRLILRTGQPGYAPEIEAIRDYDINDYKTKSELTRTHLYTAITTALRSYAQLLQLHRNREGLERIIESTRQLIEVPALPVFAEGILTQFSQLFGTPIDGLVCVKRQHGDHDIQQIIAASGQYQSYREQTTEAIEQVPIRQAIDDAFHQRSAIKTADGQVIYFAGEANVAFTIYLDAVNLSALLEEAQLKILCQTLSICARNLHLIERLHDSAYADPQLGIPNRTALAELLTSRAFSDDTHLILLDIVQFAELNNAFGFHYADSLLRRVVERLKTIESAFLARVGADVFAIVAPASALRNDRIQALFAEPFIINGQPHTASVCIGSVKLSDAQSEDAFDLIKCASLALKAAKAKGPGSRVEYSSTISHASQERTLLLHQLRTAFEKAQLFMVFQPQVSVATGQLVALEALMRWQKPDGMYVPPDKFISIAEHSGLIVPLGLWALRDALSLHNELKVRGYGPIRIAVNVSPVQLQMETFHSQVLALLQEFQIAPQWLELEVTEGVALLGPERAIRLLQQLSELGVSIALDDFGTGYSSLSHIQKMPLSRLKIDRSFISPIQQRSPMTRLVEVIIDVGKTLGLSVLAEGVETTEQWQALKRLGCHEAQGYLFSQPLDRETLFSHYLPAQFAKQTSNSSG